jgi:hypothetical protein
MITNPSKPLPPRVSLLLMVEVALASCTLLVAPFEAVTGQWRLTGLILVLVASTLVLSIDVAKHRILSRSVPDTTPLSEVSAGVHWCQFGSKLVWVITLFTAFAVMLLTSLRATGHL